MQLRQGFFLHQRLHLLALVELEVQTYLLPHPSADMAAIKNYFSGHDFLVWLQYLKIAEKGIVAAGIPHVCGRAVARIDGGCFRKNQDVGIG